MKIFTTVLFLGAFLVLIEIPETIFAHPTDHQAARPHEIWNSCGTWCESTCDHPPSPTDACIAMCKSGYFCEHGYIRETPNGRCILLSECPARE